MKFANFSWKVLLLILLRFIQMTINSNFHRLLDLLINGFLKFILNQRNLSWEDLQKLLYASQAVIVRCNSQLETKKRRKKGPCNQSRSMKKIPHLKKSFQNHSKINAMNSNQKKKYFLCKSYFSKNPTKNLNNETKTKLFSTKIIEVNEIEREIKEFAYLAVTKTTKK